mgnify:CR=1 FL=1
MKRNVAALRQALEGLGLAIQFLTRVPLPVACDWNPATRRWAARAYPVVGALIGAALLLVALLGASLPTPVLALLLVSLWVALSGGLHLDGLMDLADALGANVSLERRWAIMKDPQVGSFAILALIFHLAWKVALVWALLEIAVVHEQRLGLWWWVAIPALARFGAVALLVSIPAARAEGLAHVWQQGLGLRDLAWAALILAGLCLVAPLGVAGLGLALGAFTIIFGLGMARAFHGINGDMLGAAIEGGELWLLLCLSSWWWFATA